VHSTLTCSITPHHLLDFSSSAYSHHPPSSPLQLSEIKTLAKLSRNNADEAEMIAAHGGRNTIAFQRARTLKLYNSKRSQWAIALLITLAFAIDLSEAQLLPEPDSNLERLFWSLEIVVTLLLAAELAIHMFALSNDYLRPFFREYVNCFDTLVVFISILSIVFHETAKQRGMEDLKLFRLIRIVRVLRLLKRFESLQKIIKALTAAFMPVCNALFVLVLFTAVYACLATHLFRHRCDQYFGNFARSMFTMIQVEPWNSRNRHKSPISFIRALLSPF